MEKTGPPAMNDTATYSPEDNKLRLYPAARLDAETFERVKAHGFRWAPHQKLFVAPMWTPERADLLIELCGEIGDEDTSLVERQEERAERFADYSESRSQDADRAHHAVKQIADGIPLGQPILVGHHSERHARRDAEKIENGMRRAVKMWETSKYWTQRAAGAIRHAKYKELPTVRARRIKTIEADRRRIERNAKEAARFVELWNVNRDRIEAGTMEPLSDDYARRVSGADHISKCFTLAEFPRLTADASTYEGAMSLYSAIGGIITAEQAREIALRVHHRTIERCARWLQHLDGRLSYERAMLEEQGATQLLAKKPKSAAALLPLVNYRAPEGLTIENKWHRGTMMHYPQVEMTAAEYAAIHTDYKGTRVVDNSHRVRTAMQRHSALVCVFLTDSKVHERPAPKDPTPPAPRPPRPLQEPAAPPAPPSDFEKMRESLRAGVQTVSAPQLFPTPRELAARLVELADVIPSHRVLEPSAGTGNLIAALPQVDHITAVEKNLNLVDTLRAKWRAEFVSVLGADFLECTPAQLGTFDRVVMNPPFKDGDDIRHIQHARGFLSPGGLLVAICANGPRQQAALQPIAREWIDLGPGQFAAAGTNVNTAIVLIDGPQWVRAVVDEIATAEANAGELVDVPFSLTPTYSRAAGVQGGLF